MLSLHAKSHCVCPSAGFYFSTEDDYQSQSADAEQHHSIEEFIIQFIDGSDFACNLASAINLHQGNLASYFELLDDLDDADESQQAAFLYVLNDLGYDTSEALEKYEDVMLSEEEPDAIAQEYAEDCMELTGFALQYFDAASYVRDCFASGDWSTIHNNGTRYTVTNANGL
ncbi:MAG: hypothetical protein V7707_20155 [Motiliproteus sp.]